MFFPERITKIGPGDRVLEVGPGATPHPRSDVFLEKTFSSAEEAFNQRGRTEWTEDSRKTIFFDGGKFPFKDLEFDYIICSHVLEHVDDVDLFLRELMRVGRRGYLEFPTALYDFLYDFPEHCQLLFFDDQERIIKWLRKTDTPIHDFSAINRFLFRSFELGYHSLVNDLKNYFFTGYEWDSRILSKKVSNISELYTPNLSLLTAYSPSIAKAEAPAAPLECRAESMRKYSAAGAFRWVKRKLCAGQSR